MAGSYKNLEVVLKNRYNKLDRPYMIRTSSPFVYKTSMFFKPLNRTLEITGNVLYYYEQMNWIPYSLHVSKIDNDALTRFEIFSRSITVDTTKAFIFTGSEKESIKNIDKLVLPYIMNLSLITAESIVYQFNSLIENKVIDLISYEEETGSLDDHIYEVDFILRFKQLITGDRRFSGIKTIYDDFISNFEDYTLSFIPYKTEQDEREIKFIASKIVEYCRKNGYCEPTDGYFAIMNSLELLTSKLDYSILIKNNE